MSVHIIEHPLIKEKMSILRDKETSSRLFKECLDEVVMLMAFDVTKDLALDTYSVQTPLMETEGYKVHKPIVLVPILRAGLGFLDGMRRIIPYAHVGHIGMARNEETLLPEEYYAKFPSCLKEATVIILDPMLATGGSACDAIEALKKRGATDLRMVSLVGAPEGLAKMAEEQPDVSIYLACLDDKLNEHGYILPGLGDAGDRLFGTDE